MFQEREPSGAESGFAVAQTVPRSVLARSLLRVTRMKQCPRLSRKSPSMEKERDWWSAGLEGEMQKLEVEGSLSVAESGPMDPERTTGQLGRCSQNKKVKK